MSVIWIAALVLQLPPLGGGIPGGDAAMRPPRVIRQAERGETPPTPIGNQGDWFPYEAYPEAARRANEQGRVGLSVDVDATGRPTACHVTSSSGSARLDQATCDLAMANARFTPARARGQTVASRFTIRNVVWKLTEPEPIDLTTGEKVLADSVIEITVAADGTATACKATLIYPPGTTDPCAGMPIGRKSSPMIRNGVPVGGKVIMRQSATLVPDIPATP